MCFRAVHCSDLFLSGCTSIHRNASSDFQGHSPRWFYHGHTTHPIGVILHFACADNDCNSVMILVCLCEVVVCNPLQFRPFYNGDSPFPGGIPTVCLRVWRLLSRVPAPQSQLQVVDTKFHYLDICVISPKLIVGMSISTRMQSA